MVRKRLSAWHKRIIIAVLAAVASFTVSLILPHHSNTPEATSQQPANQDTVISVQAGTKKRVDKLKASMLSSWEQQAEAKSLLVSAPAKFRGTTINDVKLSRASGKYIALTFDDGPWPQYTEQVLDILKREKVKGTFFVVGKMLEAYPQVAVRVATEGHSLANHTWHHWYHFFNEKAAAFEIDKTNELIYKTTGVTTTLFRPPGGILTNGLAAYARKKKFTVVMWSADSKDYTRPSVAGLVNNVMRPSKPGGIVLMHDGGGNRSRTVEALPQIIARFRQQGYKFVTVSELMELQEKEKNTITAKS